MSWGRLGVALCREVQSSGGVDRGVPGSPMANREHGRVHGARVDAVLPVISCLQKQKSKGERGDMVLG